jgi:hypothetical protein
MHGTITRSERAGAAGGGVLAISAATSRAMDGERQATPRVGRLHRRPAGTFESKEPHGFASVVRGGDFRNHANGVLRTPETECKLSQLDQGRG